MSNPLPDHDTKPCRANRDRFRLAGWLIWALAAGLAGARLLLGDLDSMEPPGQGLLSLDRFYGWWTACALALSCLSLGLLLMRLPLLRDIAADEAVRTGLALMAGWWVLTCGLTVWVWLTDLARVPAGVWWALLAAGSAGSWPGACRAFMRANDLVARFWQEASSRRRLLATGVVLAVLLWLVPYAVQTLLPDWEWDGANVLLPQAKRLATGGIWNVRPHETELLRPAGGSLLYALCLAARAEAAILPLNLLASLGVGALAWSAARALAGPRAGWMAALVAMTPNLLWELGTDSRVDNLAALGVAGAVLGVVAWWQDRRHPGPIIVSCMAMGVAMGIKASVFYPAAGFAVAWTVAGVIALRASAWRAVPAIGMAMVVLLVPAGSWYLRNMMLGANAMGTYAGRLGLAKGSANAPLPEEVMAAARQREMILALPYPDRQQFVRPRHYDPLVLFLPTDRHSVKALQWLSPLLLGFVLLPIWRRDAIAWWLVLLAAGTTAAIGMQYWVVRYMTVALPLMCIAAGLVYARCRGRVGLTVLAVLLTVQLAWNAQAEWRKLGRLHLPTVLAGNVSPMQWLGLVGYSGGSTALPQVIMELNRTLRQAEPDAPLATLPLFEYRTYHIQGPLCEKRFVDIAAAADGNASAIAAALRDQGVGYILLSRWGARRSLYTANNRSRETVWALLYLAEQLMREHGQILMVRPPIVGDPVTGALLSDPDIILIGLNPPQPLTPDSQPAPSSQPSTRP